MLQFNIMPSIVLGGQCQQLLLVPWSLFQIITLYLGLCFVHQHNPSHDKLDPKSIKCIFLDTYAIGFTILQSVDFFVCDVSLGGHSVRSRMLYYEGT